MKEVVHSVKRFNGSGNLAQVRLTLSDKHRRQKVRHRWTCTAEVERCGLASLTRQSAVVMMTTTKRR